MTKKLTKEKILEALSKVQEPELHKDLVALNMIRDLQQGQRGRDIQLMPGEEREVLPPLDEYRIEPVAQRYEFWLQALRAGDEPAELARKTLP